MENELFNVNPKIRYRFPVRKKSKILVLAPHPDDETIGCAGTLALFQKQEVEIIVVLFTREENGNIADIRQNEFECAMKVLACKKTIMLSFPDGQLVDYYDETKTKLANIISVEKPDIIFTPYILDYHPDHRCVSRILEEIIKEQEILVAMYEVWVPILYPDYYIDISEVWSDKLEALAAYRSQEESYQIKKKVLLLNQLRAQLSLRRNVKYIEAFRSF